MKYVLYNPIYRTYIKEYNSSIFPTHVTEEATELDSVEAEAIMQLITRDWDSSDEWQIAPADLPRE